MVKKKRKHGGHYCKVCGCHKSNESFSGRGHALHICKECQSLPKDEQADMMRCNEVERAAFRFPMRRQDWELLEKYAKKYSRPTRFLQYVEFSRFCRIKRTFSTRSGAIRHFKFSIPRLTCT